MCSSSSITMPSLVGLGFHPLPGWPKMLSFLSVCLSVTLLNVRDCMPDLATKALEYRKDFDAAGWGKVCSCATVLDFLRFMPTGDITKCRSPKMAKIGVFCRHRTTEYTDQHEISQINVYRGSATAHQIWLSSVKGGWYRSPQKCHNAGTMNTFR